MSARETELFGQPLRRLRVGANLLFAGLLPVQWLAAVAYALVTAPTAWDGAAMRTNPHLWAAIGLGALATLPTLWLVRKYPHWTGTRHAVAAAQLIFSGIFVDVTGGRIETHFHVFGSLAILAFYRDPAVLLTATLVTLTDHAVRGAIAPETIYGVASIGLWRTLEHGGWIAFEDVMLALGIRTSLIEMRTIARQRGELEDTQAELARAAAVQHRHEVADQVVQAEHREIERGVEERTRFLSTMSHELRTPLNAVVGFLDLLSFTTLDDTQSAHVAGAKVSSRHMLDLVNDFLDHVKLEHGKVELWRTPFSAESAVREATTLVQRLASEKSLALDVSVSDDVPPWVLGDALRVRQILVNLLGNAVKFTSAGGVRTHVSRAKDDANAIVFAIEDDGPGIAPEQHGRIFEPFRQADRTTSRVFGGTGLGLSISRQLARKMGGELAVCSTPGRGATFWLTLPLPPTQAPASHSTANVEVGAAPRALRVLLADDDATNRLVGRQLLARLGHTVELAVDGAEALQRALEQRHDLVVMDVEMPNLDGLEATRRLRAAKIAIPVLGFTAHVDAAHIAACRTAGMNGVVHKPMDLERLALAIAHVLSATAAPSPPSPVEIPAPSVPATPTIDLAELRNRVGGDVALFDEVLAAVVVEVRKLSADMEEAGAAADVVRLRRTAHTLRGCLANVGAKDLVARLATLEEAAASSDAPRARSLLTSIAPRCAEAQRALEVAVGADRQAA